MKKYFLQNILTLVGVLIGSIGGLLYWEFIGCSSCTCYIQSNPVRITIYGALMGGLIFNIFQSKKSQQQQ